MNIKCQISNLKCQIIRNWKFDIGSIGYSWQCQAGFTLIELLLYLAIVSIVLMSLIPFAWNVIESGSKSSTEQEVFSNARYISERIKYEIRNSFGINSPAAGASGTQLILCTNSACSTTETIDVSGGNIRINPGSGTINLNSANTTVSSITFTSYSSSSDTKTKHVQFLFILSANYSSSRQEFKESTTIESSAEVRSN